MFFVMEGSSVTHITHNKVLLCVNVHNYEEWISQQLSK
jgi:hypothetical protein